MGMSKHQHICLKENERTELEQLIKSGTHSARVIARARTLLLLDRSQGDKRTIAQVVDAGMVSQGTIANLKKRYFAGGLERALYELPRPGAKPKIDGEVEAHLIALTCSEPPEGHDQWTLRLLADRLVSLEVIDAISHVAVGDALKKMNLSLGKSNRGTSPSLAQDS
jgi:transposase